MHLVPPITKTNISIAGLANPIRSEDAVASSYAKHGQRQLGVPLIMCHPHSRAFRMLQEGVSVLDCHNWEDTLIRVQGFRVIVITKGFVEEYMIRLTASFA